MLRHVVLFTWSDDADEERREQTLAALRRLPEEVGGMTSFAVGPDAGLREGNAHTALVADFPDVEAWRRYADHPVHLQVIADHVKPILAARSAVQYEVPRPELHSSNDFIRTFIRGVKISHAVS